MILPLVTGAGIVVVMAEEVGVADVIVVVVVVVDVSETLLSKIISLVPKPVFILEYFESNLLKEVEFNLFKEVFPSSVTKLY